MKYIFAVVICLLASCSLMAQYDADSTATLEETLSSDADAESYEQHDSIILEGSAEDDEASYEQSTVNNETYAPDQMVAAKKYKSEKLTIKKFDQEKWRKIVGKTNYDEEKKEEPKEENAQKVVHTANPWSGEILKIVSWVFVSALVLLIIYYVFKSVKITKKLTRQPSVTDETLATTVEDIDEFDVNYLLQKALREGNFKLAVRLYYLALLKTLNETGLIAWQKEKTNREYLSELFSNVHFQQVKTLTLAYERVWYGEHALTQETFQRLASDFESLNQKLNTIKEQ